MFPNWFRRKRSSADFEAEIEAHLQLEADALAEQGIAGEQARTAAHRAFGNPARAKERFWESTHWVGLDSFWRDVRYATRCLRKTPGFTLTAIITLAVAIAANAVVFGALNAVILRPLDVPQPQSLYALQPRLNDTSLHMSYPDYLDFLRRNRSFQGLAAFNLTEAGVNSGTQAAEVWLTEVTGNYFDVLGIHPLLGRLLHASDEHGVNGVPGVVLSYAYWHSRFRNDPGVIGRTLLLDRHPFTIIGVTPRGFRGTIMFFRSQLFVPLLDAPQFEGVNQFQARAKPWLFFGAMGHLKPGVSRAAAVADLNAIGAELNKSYPREESPYSFSLKRPSLYGDFLGRPVRAFLGALMLLAALILLAACANLGSLFAARASDRAREVAMRLALGAGRLRVMRQLFTEALLVALAGGGIGLGCSVMLLQLLSRWRPLPQFPINLPVSPDAHVYEMALGLAILSGILFAAAPIRKVLRTEPYAVVKAGVGETRRAASKIRQTLLALQIAICALLITASLVAVRGLARTVHGHFGIAPQNAMLVTTDLTMAGYPPAAMPAMQKRMLAAVHAMPGVQAVGLTDWVPLGNEGWKDEPVFRDSAADRRTSQEAADATVLKISPGYLRAAGTALLAGRDLAWSDDAGAARVALVNQKFARQLFGSTAAAMGQHYRLQDGTRIEVAGVVENGKYNSLTETQEPAMFLPLLQWPSTSSVMVVRSARNPQALVRALKQRLRQLDPGLPSLVQTWNQAMSGPLFASRIAASALGLLGFMGAILSLTGIFGLAASAVGKRRRELGIRMALGALPRQLLRAALGPVLRLLAIGSTAGLVLGILAARVLGAVVYKATPRDPLVMAGVVAAMALIGSVAMWVPARRALEIRPAALLRED